MRPLPRSGDSPVGRIVVLDPDPVNARVLCALFGELHEVVAVTSATELLRIVFGGGVDIVLVEVDCGDADGFDLCTKLRSRGYRGPVVFVTARDGVAEKLRAFDSGADDYVVKPFDGRELQARVGAVARRVREAHRLALGRDLRVGDAVLSPGAGVFQIDGRAPAYLSPTEVRLLECLMRDSAVTIGREALLERTWPNAFVGGATRVDVVVARIRKKIEPDASQPRYLHTVRGFGYTFRPSLRPRLATEPADEELAAVPAAPAGA